MRTAVLGVGAQVLHSLHDLVAVHDLAKDDVLPRGSLDAGGPV